MAISTKTDIYNIAVSLLGDSALQLTGASTVDNTNTKATRQFNLHYDPTLDELTRQHTWNCCINRDQLTTAEYTEHGWSYSASLPSGTIRALALTDNSTAYKYLVYTTDWVVEGASILCNVENPYLTFLKIPSIADMDVMFIKALYYSLAIKMAIPITGDRQVRADLIQEYLGNILPEAKRIDGFEGNEEIPYESDWLGASYINGFGDSYYYSFPWAR